MNSINLNNRVYFINSSINYFSASHADGAAFEDTFTNSTDNLSRNDVTSLEGNLLKALLDNGYDKRMRPVKIPTETLNVNVSFVVFNLVDMVSIAHRRRSSIIITMIIII